MGVQAWDLKKLFKAPSFQKVKAYEGWFEGLSPILYDCGKWQGRKVKAFAWLGLPPDLKPGEKCPGVVLVHGGGGTAFASWVKLWNERGYAAISMDTCGGIPCWNESPSSRYLWPRHKFSGPPGWGDFEHVDESVNEQWPFQAVSTVVAAHSLLRSLPEVDAARIGLTGVSWGGVLTCMAAGADSRFAFAAPVYGCGFLDASVFTEGMPPRSTPEKNAKWLSMWDPSLYLPQAKARFLWVNGTNDFAFNMESMVKSSRQLESPSEFHLPVRMGHGHGAVSERPPEILDFANRVLGFGKSLPSPELGASFSKDGQAFASFKPGWKAAKAEFNYTLGTGIWKERLWETAPAALDLEKGLVSAALPEGATSFYFNLFSESGLLFSACPAV